jgi:hypothetical protein
MVYTKNNQRNVRIWGRNNPNAVIEDTRDRSNFNILCAVFKQIVFRLFIFDEGSVIGVVYLDML